MTSKSRAFTEENNFQQLHAWAVADLGVRYALPTATPILLKAEITNVLDKQYWATSERGFLGYGDVRTIRAAVQVDF